ncbi:hypothetical protein CR513_58409, partial [Mucuna pruriens]
MGKAGLIFPSREAHTEKGVKSIKSKDHIRPKLVPNLNNYHRQFLPLDHPYKRNKNSFKKRCVETSHPPPQLSILDIWKRVAHLPFSYDLQEEEQEILGYGVQHNWKKQSIFWRLSYWNTHLLCHNIDVMHTKRNFFMNAFDTMMNINGRTKDTHKARMDITLVHRVKIFKPKATYVLTTSQRVWVKELKLPDGYASNLDRCIDVNQGKLHGMKSHDCHNKYFRQPSLIQWSIFQFIYRMRLKLVVQSNNVGCTLLRETSTFVLFYYPDKIEMRRTKVKVLHLLLLYQFLTTQEVQVDLEVAHLYILLNGEHVEPYL